MAACFSLGLSRFTEVVSGKLVNTAPTVETCEMTSRHLKLKYTHTLNHELSTSTAIETQITMTSQDIVSIQRVVLKNTVWFVEDTRSSEKVHIEVKLSG